MERISNALRRLVDARLTRLDYGALHPATVLVDHGNMTLDVQPDSPKLPQMTDVPLAGILPNCRVKVRAEARVFVGFENGEPTKPRCHVFDSGVLELIDIRTGYGQSITIDDDRGNTSRDKEYINKRIIIKDAKGQTITMSAKDGAEFIELKDFFGQTITLDPITQHVEVKANLTVNIRAGVAVHIDAPLVNAGGRPVAHVGDKTTVGGVILPV